MASERSSRWIRRLGTLAAVAVSALIVALILPALQQARQSARRNQTAHNLRSIGLALGTYHDVFRRLPHGGVFDEAGQGHFAWNTALNTLLAQRAAYDGPDSRFPWDHPRNIDRVRQEWGGVWQNPGQEPARSGDGLPLIHYAANQTLFHRNSDRSLNDLPQAFATALVGEANDDFPPIGFPWNWRDLTIPLGSSSESFGCPGSRATMFLMEAGSIRTVDNLADPAIARSLSGPAAMAPTPAQVARPSNEYHVAGPYWSYLNVVRRHKGLMTFALSPDRTRLEVDFRNYDDPEEATPERWERYFADFHNNAPIEHVIVRGRLRARELAPFARLERVHRLTISEAEVADEVDSALGNVLRRVTID